MKSSHGADMPGASLVGAPAISRSWCKYCVIALLVLMGVEEAAHLL